MRTLCTSVSLAVLALASLAAAAPVGTAFDYQGALLDGGNPATGYYDFQFSLFDAPAGGNQVGATIQVNGVAVSAGRYVAMLDFGTGVFNGTAFYLQVNACTNGANSFASTGVRDPLLAAPYALYALNAGVGGTNADSIAGSGGFGTNLTLAGNTLITGSLTLSNGPLSALSHTALTNASAAGWRNALGAYPEINVKDYGAKGDGLTDDTDALLNAISTNGSGKVVYLPCGIYMVSRPLVVPQGTKLLGAGTFAAANDPARSTCIRAASGFTGVGILLSDTWQAGDYWVKGAIEDLSVDCNYVAPFGICIHAAGEMATLRRVDINHALRSGCWFTGPHATLCVENCTINRSGDYAVRITRHPNLNISSPGSSGQIKFYGISGDDNAKGFFFCNANVFASVEGLKVEESVANPEEVKLTTADYQETKGVGNDCWSRWTFLGGTLNTPTINTFLTIEGSPAFRPAVVLENLQLSGPTNAIVDTTHNQRIELTGSSISRCVYSLQSYEVSQAYWSQFNNNLLVHNGVLRINLTNASDLAALSLADNPENPYPFQVIGSDSLSEATPKAFRMGMRSFSLTDSPHVLLYGGEPNSGAAFLRVGGGTSLGTTFQKIQFFTAPDSSTPGGNLAMTLFGSGGLALGASPTDPGPGNLTLPGTLNAANLALQALVPNALVTATPNKTLASLPPGSPNQLLGLNSAGGIEYKTLAAGNGLSLTQSAGAITLAAVFPTNQPYLPITNAVAQGTFTLTNPATGLGTLLTETNITTAGLVASNATFSGSVSLNGMTLFNTGGLGIGNNCTDPGNGNLLVLGGITTHGLIDKTLTPNTLLLAGPNQALTSLPLGAANQLLGIGSSGALEYKTLAAGPGISIVPAAGTLTVAAQIPNNFLPLTNPVAQGTLVVTNPATQTATTLAGGTVAATTVAATNATLGTLTVNGMQISPPVSLNLTANNLVVWPTNCAYLRLSSNNSTASNRTFVLASGLPGQALELEWVGPGAGQLLDNATNSMGGAMRLSANWRPSKNNTLSLRFNGTDWLETSRSANQ